MKLNKSFKIIFYTYIIYYHMPVKKIKVESENESDTPPKEEIKEQPKEQLKDMIFE